MRNPILIWGFFILAALIFQVSSGLGAILALAWVVWFFGSIIYEPKDVRVKRAERRQAQRATEEFLRERRRERDRKIAAGESPPDFRSYDEYINSAWWRTLSQHTLQYLGGKCEFCAANASQVHHVRYPRHYGYESIKSLYAVCHRCHEVAHGAHPNHSHGCAFCGSAPTQALDLEHSHSDRSQHQACRRCWHLASGFRGQALGWPKYDYEGWVKTWRESFPGVRT